MGVVYSLVCDERKERLNLGKRGDIWFQGILDIDTDGEESYLLPAGPAIERFIADCTRNNGGQAVMLRLIPDTGSDQSDDYQEVSERYRTVPSTLTAPPAR